VLLFRQHFVVPAMLAALAVLWWSAPPVSAAYEPEWGSITKTIAAPNRRRL
jgi:hypothetical protein